MASYIGKKNKFRQILKISVSLLFYLEGWVNCSIPNDVGWDRKKASRNGRNSICRAKKFNSRRTTKISLNSHFRFRPHSPNNDLILHRLLWKFYSAFQPKIMIKWLIYISHEKIGYLYGIRNYFRVKNKNCHM